MARSNECAPKGVPPLNFCSMKKPSAKKLTPKLHQVSEKALMPTKKLRIVVWSSIKRWRDQINAPQQVSPHFEFFFNEKAFGKKSRFRITSSQRESLNATEKAHYFRVVKH